MNGAVRRGGIAALFRHTPRIHNSPRSSHILPVLHPVEAGRRSLTCTFEYYIRFLKKQRLLTGETLDSLPSALVARQ